MTLIMTATLAVSLAVAPVLAVDDEPAKRLDEAAAVFSEIMATPDKGIPQDLLEKAHCIVIVPDLKTGAFIVGGKFGKGYVSCRNTSGAGWSAPGTVRIEGGSVDYGGQLPMPAPRQAACVQWMLVGLLLALPRWMTM